MRVIFTDLDGTLLDERTYSWADAQPALDRLRESNVPLVLTTSKTRAEVEMWRAHFGNEDPFISENGGGIFIPQGYFPFRAPASIERDGYDVIELGDRYDDLVETLGAAAAESGTNVVGFHSLSAEEVSRRCGLPLEQARLAKRREYDEPFEIEAGQDSIPLIAAIEKRGKRYTKGGRFHHITGKNDKAAAVILLTNLYRRVHHEVFSIGFGDAWNDVGFLNAVQVPVLMQSPSVGELEGAVARVRVTRRSGPAGWSEALIDILRE
jgi:mannosyl-3-phosphoglycerate phosphatase